MRRVLRPGVLTALLLAAFLAPAALDGQRANDADPLLRVGDRVRVQVWRQPELSGEFTVTETGVIGHPLFRSVVAAGRSSEEIRSSLGLFLEEYETEPNFVVEVFVRVIVGGQVRSPGVQFVRPGTTVAEAIQLAGGWLDLADPNRVTLRRDAREFRGTLTDSDGAFRGVTLRSGDEVIMERRRQIFRNYVLPTISFVGSVASIYRVFDRR